MTDTLLALPHPTFVADDDARYVLTNQAASSLTGYSSEELKRLSVWDLTPAPLEHEAEVLWRTFLSTGSQHGDYVLICRDGNPVFTQYAARARIAAARHVSILR